MTAAPASPFMNHDELPLRGIKVLELSHMIMGPAAGLALADLGAEVIKLEPIDGDRTRRLKGSGSGYFPVFNRNKQSLSIDLKSAEGQALARQLALQADMVVENFRDGGLAQYGLDYASLSAENPRLIYVSLKGFLSGPYKHRTALDEVVQMMGGLAYINGGADTPQRVAASVNDILGGTFGVVGALAALHDRHVTGRGRHVRSGLFENNLLLVAQFIAQYQLTGAAPKPFGAERKPPWGVYDVFETADGRVFVAVVGDAQWRNFAQRFLPPEWAADPRLATAVDREAARSWLVPGVGAILKTWKTDELCAALEAANLSYGPIRQPHDLLHDEHLNAGGALLATALPDGGAIAAAALPIEFDGLKAGKRFDPPAQGRDTEAILRGLGLDAERIKALRAAGVVHCEEKA
ncbi:Formyl-CoA:oxalate CoA-transferase [Achromobacter pulmonis]|uniref:CaiB/BaiF CoA transferase family protein n=1 Tax=Achromobacter pulmonis TaxID=1389932 RepID=UPI001468C700|nr:CaiB/BaiF CoA-transferase family protein [Achromobacter pulmonis]CAB3625702.1 Formyl-CoA:oxalate CoA-transferase [Achromobacter pulmonis]